MSEYNFENLTLTRVVFEFISAKTERQFTYYLTLTRVVFEFPLSPIIMFFHFYLTLTRVVFESCNPNTIS